ncbi:biopolymer transport protein ExbD/TolR [Roseovarius sp. A-2]|uniref:ExbD/TolR family protein n=1 Tax=Roseovarius sp. A-2 TaxID=1570360 RepID=UPI0009B555FD|nr:biopolymer transporter ExbD [Roseovarius sp. A-2]GAW34299.1 biopolymer transport protein ExbD/TolR [Roseovarius sp. A-2]
MRKQRHSARIEPTIALINVVFLMLVFFMVASTIAPPMDRDLSLVRTSDLDGRAPPDTLVAHPDGRLTYRGEAVASAQAFYATRPEDAPDEVRIVPDRALPATTLVDLARELRAAGASSVVIVTQRGLE